MVYSYTVNPMDRLRHAVRETLGITPDESLLNLIPLSFGLSARLLTSDTTNSLIHLYDTLLLMPRTATRTTICDIDHIILGDELSMIPSTSTAIFIRAWDKCLPKICKIPYNQTVARRECMMYEAIVIDSEGQEYALVPATSLVLENAANRVSKPRMVCKYGILMPQYACTLDQIPVPIDPAGALAYFDRLYNTLVYINNQGWMHGDVKPSNVFIDNSGIAWLGDYGSSVRIGQLSTYTGGTLLYQCREVDYMSQPLKHDLIGLVLTILNKFTPYTVPYTSLSKIVECIHAVEGKGMCVELRERCIEICNSV